MTTKQTVDEVVRILTVDPTLDTKDPLRDVANRLGGWTIPLEVFDPMFKRIVLLLREMIALEKIDAKFQPKPPVATKRRRAGKPRRRGQQPDLFRGQA
jgi:hypothetical protein